MLIYLFLKIPDCDASYSILLPVLVCFKYFSSILLGFQNNWTIFFGIKLKMYVFNITEHWFCGVRNEIWRIVRRIHVIMQRFHIYIINCRSSYLLFTLFKILCNLSPVKAHRIRRKCFYLFWDNSLKLFLKGKEAKMLS